MLLRKQLDGLNLLKGGLLTGSFVNKSGKIDNEALYNIAFGFGISASGGGGSFLQGLSIAQQSIDDGFDSIYLQDPTEISQNEVAFVSGGIGKPAALKNPVTFGNKVIALLVSLESYLESQSSVLKGILPIEAGPINGLLPIYTVYKYNQSVDESKQISLYDCDGSGRAVPSMTTSMYDEYFENGTCPIAYNFKDDSKATKNVLIQSSDVLNGADAEQIFSGVMMYGRKNEAIPLACWKFDANMAANGVGFPIGTYTYWMHMGGLFKKAYKNKDALKLFLTAMNKANSYSFSDNSNSFSEFEPLMWTGTLDSDSLVEVANDRWDCGYIVFETEMVLGKKISEKRLYYVNENLTVSKFHCHSKEVTNLATAPSSITAFFYDDDPPSGYTIGTDGEQLEAGYIPYNTGDLKRIKDLCDKNAEIIVAVTDPTVPYNTNYLYQDDMCNRFIDVMNSTFGTLRLDNWKSGSDNVFPPKITISEVMPRPVPKTS